jgi:hypothetical protein
MSSSWKHQRPNSNTGKLSVWPKVAFGLLLEAEFIVSRTMTSSWLESPQEHICLPSHSQFPSTTDPGFPRRQEAQVSAFAGKDPPSISQ